MSGYFDLLKPPDKCQHTVWYKGEYKHIDKPYNPKECGMCRLSQTLAMELLYGRWPTKEETAKQAKEESLRRNQETDFSDIPRTRSTNRIRR